MRLLFLISTFVITLAACGKTGALYLPDDKETEAPAAKKESSSES